MGVNPCPLLFGIDHLRKWEDKLVKDRDSTLEIFTGPKCTFLSVGLS